MVVATGGAAGVAENREKVMSDVGGVAGKRLKSLIERIERLEEEKRALREDIKEVYAEAKGIGFDTKIMRQLIRERRKDADDLDEEATLLDLYRRAIDCAAATAQHEQEDDPDEPGLPLGRAAAPEREAAE